MKWQRFFTGMIEISKKLIYPAILVAIIILIVAFGLYVFRCIPVYKEIAVKYDILKDFLGIFFAIMAVVSVGLYVVLRTIIKGSIEKDIDKKFSTIRGGISLLHGLVLWNVRDFDGAIRETKAALGKNLGRSDEVWVKNNLAYYYATKHQEDPPQWHLKAEAIKFAEYAYKKYDRYTKAFNNPYWVETYAFVKARFAKEDAEKEKVREEIRGLLQRKDLSEIEEDLKKSLNYLNQNDHSGV